MGKIVAFVTWKDFQSNKNKEKEFKVKKIIMIRYSIIQNFKKNKVLEYYMGLYSNPIIKNRKR